MNTKKAESYFLDTIKMIGICFFALTLCLLSWITIYYVGSKIKNFTTPYYHTISNNNKSESNEMAKIKTLSCYLTCEDGTTKSKNANWLLNEKGSCYIPDLNPIIIKLDETREKISYISTSDNYIETKEFGIKTKFTVGEFRHELLENGSFASWRNYNGKWNKVNQGLCSLRSTIN